MKKFIYGLNSSVKNSVFLNSEELCHKVGLNSGNLAFHYAIEELIGQDIPVVSWSSDVNIINAAGELAVMPCANQLGNHVDMKGFAEKFKKVKTNIMAVGLGAQGSILYNKIPEIPAGTLHWIDQIVKHGNGKGPNISVRGDFTQKVMEHYGYETSSIALGCPSLLINSNPNLGKHLEKKYKEDFLKVGVAAGHPAWTPIRHVERALVTIMEEYNGEYIVQAEPNMIAMSRNDMGAVSDEFLEKFKDYIKPNASYDEFSHWIRKYMFSFYDIPAWMEYMRRFDFVVGSRIHGVMLAIQSGVPGLCIAHDSRIRELCEISRIPWISAYDLKAGFTLNDLIKLTNFDSTDFDKNRIEKRKKTTEFFNINDC